jgi:hypothetical protein
LDFITGDFNQRGRLLGLSKKYITQKKTLQYYKAQKTAKKNITKHPKNLTDFITKLGKKLR